MGKKAALREARVQAARQRMRLHAFVAVLLDIFYQWRTNDKLKDEIAKLPANERRYIGMQTAKVEKRLKVIVRMLGADYPRSAGSALFADASAMVNLVLAHICRNSVTPLDTNCLEVQCVMTYIFTTAVYEMDVVCPDDRPEVQAFLRDGMAFADHIIPNDSRMLMPLNDTYWATREYLHSGAPLPVWDFSKCLPGSAEYERKQGRAA